MSKPRWSDIFDFSDRTISSLILFAIIALIFVTGTQIYFLKMRNEPIVIHEFISPLVPEREEGQKDLKKGKVPPNHTELEEKESKVEENYDDLQPPLIQRNDKKNNSGFVGSKTPDYRKKERISAPLDINLADTTEFKKLKGIGSYRASRIVRFRDALGGFYSVQQVGETYGLPDSVFNDIKQYLFLGQSPRKIAIDTASTQTLAKHPYISTKEAYEIKKLTLNNYTLEEKKEILREKLSRYEQVAPYLILD